MQDVLQPAVQLEGPQPGCSWFDELKENIEVSDDEVCFNSDLFYNFTLLSITDLMN